MRYCARCGKEIKDTDGMYCDECFSDVVTMKVNGEKKIYKKVHVDRKVHDELPDRNTAVVISNSNKNPDANQNSVKPQRYVKEIEGKSYLKLFLGIFITLLGVLCFAFMGLFSIKISTVLMILGIVLVFVGVIEILKERVLSKSEKMASIIEICVLGFGIIGILSFFVTNLK